VTACGVLLADHHGALNVLAASTEQTRLLELFQLQNSQGPCLDCYRTGTNIQCADLSAGDARWPLFAPVARDYGFAAVHALPMRLRDEVLGAVNLFSASPGDLDAETIELGQSLADVATIGIVHERTIRRREEVTEQLQTALNSRILIEQAKGSIAQRLNISVDQAFAVLRAHARSTNSKLTEVAAAVIETGLVIVRPETAPLSNRNGRKIRSTVLVAGATTMAD